MKASRFLSRNILSAAERRDLAKTIQFKQYESPDAEAWKMCYTQMKCKRSGQIFKIHHNHQKYNGMDVISLIEANRSLFLKDVARFSLPNENPEDIWVERSAAWDDGAVHFNGPQNVKPKDVARDMYELATCGNRFYMPIDMFHYFGEPCLLNYTFDDTKSFDENWEEIRRIKKSENGYVLQNNRWKTLLEPQLSWLTTVSVNVPDAEIRSAAFKYNPQLQGLAVVVSNEASYWTFCFRADPTLAGIFVRKYGLEIVNE